MKYLSVCSGIEAATVAWRPLGWKAIAYSEIDRFPSAVLAHHYPHVPNLGDMTKFKEWPDAIVDVLVGGTPCQSFSVAGLRKGLADPRGNLMLTYLAIAARYRPEWLVWENVPGVLSADEGRAFGTFVWTLGELGYGWAYRCLDAQYFNLAQRRERVFVVASLRGWASAAAVLFERASLQGHPAPSREKGERVAPTVASGAPFGRTGNERSEVDAYYVPTVSAALRSRDSKGTPQDYRECAPTLDSGAPHAFDARQSDVLQYGDKSGPIDTCCHSIAVAFNSDQPEKTRSMGERAEQAPTIRAGGEVSVAKGMSVRRLTPGECEILMGFPRGYTAIPYNGKPAKDGPRYKALGNSMAVPVMRWIGERIDAVEIVIEQAR